jgi:hypothetical protein
MHGPLWANARVQLVQEDAGATAQLQRLRAGVEVQRVEQVAAQLLEAGVVERLEQRGGYWVGLFSGSGGKLGV